MKLHPAWPQRYSVIPPGCWLWWASASFFVVNLEPHCVQVTIIYETSGAVSEAMERIGWVPIGMIEGVVLVLNSRNTRGCQDSTWWEHPLILSPLYVSQNVRRVPYARNIMFKDSILPRTWPSPEELTETIRIYIIWSPTVGALVQTSCGSSGCLAKHSSERSPPASVSFLPKHQTTRPLPVSSRCV